MNIYILESNFDKAKEIGNKILSNMNIGFTESSPIQNSKSGSNKMFENSGQFDFFNEQMSIS